MIYRSRRYSTMSSSSSSGGIGFGGALAILFIGLKLGGVITWSWLWVLSPLWIPFVLVLFILAVVAVGFFLGSLFRAIFDR